jgi:hypothetical protein
MRNIFFTSLAALFLAVSSAAAHADSYNLTLMSGTTAFAPISVTDTIYDGVAAKQYTYLDVTLGLANPITGLASVTTSTFTATYAALSPTASVLNVTDVCAQVALFGQVPGCQDFAFSATNVKLGDGEDGFASASALVLASANVGIGFADLNIAGQDLTAELASASIGQAGGTFNFGPPPTVAATPEPGSLCLLATGALSAAGVVRRRLSRAAA